MTCFVRYKWDFAQGCVQFLQTTWTCRTCQDLRVQCCVISEVASPELPSVSRLILLGLQLQMERSNTPQALVLSPQQIPVVRATTQHKEQVLLTQKQDLMEVITSRENSPKQPSRFS